MKKALALLIALTMIFSLCACGGKAEPAAETKADSAKTEKPIETVDDGMDPVALTDGWWVSESVTVDGSDMTEMYSQIFGAAESIFSIRFRDNGLASYTTMGESLYGPYKMAGDNPVIGSGEAELTFVRSGPRSLELSNISSYSVTDADGKESVLESETVITLNWCDTEPQIFIDDPMLSLNPYMAVEETRKMSDFMNYGWYWIDEDNSILYGLYHINKDKCFAAIPYAMDGNWPVIDSDKVTVLDMGVCPECLTMYNGQFYYIAADKDDNWTGVYSINPDGSGKTCLYDGQCDYLQVSGGKLWFTDSRHYEVCADLDGGNVTDVIETKCYFPYFICDNWLIYQDDADGESFHLFHTPSGTDLTIIEEHALTPVLCGTMLYYDVREGDDFRLMRMDLSDPLNLVPESGGLKKYDGFYCDGETISAVGCPSKTLENWQYVIFSDEYDFCEYRLVSDNFTVTATYDKNLKYVKEKTFTNRNTSYGVTF